MKHLYDMLFGDLGELAVPSEKRHSPSSFEEIECMSEAIAAHFLCDEAS